MTDTMQRPTLSLPHCKTGRAGAQALGLTDHDWRVSTWTEFDIAVSEDNPEPVRGRVASAFYCSRCLAQVDSATLYAEREKPETALGDFPEGDPLDHLRRLRDELAEAEVVAVDTPAGAEASLRVAVLDWAVARLSERSAR